MTNEIILEFNYILAEHLHVCIKNNPIDLGDNPVVTQLKIEKWCQSMIDTEYDAVVKINDKFFNNTLNVSKNRDYVIINDREFIVIDSITDYLISMYELYSMKNKIKNINENN